MSYRILILHTYSCALLGSLRVVNKDRRLCTLDNKTSSKYEVNPLSPNMDYHYELEKKEVK